MKVNLEKYEQYLDQLKIEKYEKINLFKKNHCDDDADLTKIELNIIDIFEKMLTVATSNPKGDFKSTYLNFFIKLPKSWHDHLVKCEAFGDEIEAHKERLKIAQAEQLKIKFLELYRED